MLVGYRPTEQKNFRPKKNFWKKIQNLRKNFRIKKSSAEQKNFRAEDFFVRKIFTNIRKKRKSSKRRYVNFIRNEDHSMLISQNTNVRVFPETIVCGP